MKLEINNNIQIDNETEMIHEIHDCQFIEKGSYVYLNYINAEVERVVIKANHEELLMTKFSNPKSVMRFHRETPALVNIPTPLGVQHLITETSHYQFDLSQQRLHINYVLKQTETGDCFANYELRIQWY